jgi:hypothetical protein
MTCGEARTGAGYAWSHGTLDASFPIRGQTQMHCAILRWNDRNPQVFDRAFPEE